MNTCLVYPTSLEYWFNDQLMKRFPYQPVSGSVRFGPPSGDEWERVARGCSAIGLSFPLHVLVNDPDDYRRPNSARKVHKLTITDKYDLFGQIGRGLYTQSPEASFIDSGAHLTLSQQAQLGCELCGSFSLDPSQVGGVLQRNAITTPQKMHEAVIAHSDMRNTSRARRLLDLGFIMPGGRSPMEITLMLLLCLPPRYGGYNLPRPTLNKRIDPLKRNKGLVTQTYFAGDLVWEHGDRRVIVEYDSDAVHEGNYDRDRNRAAQLRVIGYDVLSATPRMLYDFDATEQIARRVAKLLGISIRREYLGATTARAKLRSDLLHDIPWRLNTSHLPETIS